MTDSYETRAFPSPARRNEPRTPPGASGWARSAAAGIAAVGSALLAGCITVTAPDKPIVIELNVNIRQEVIYRLAADAKSTVEENQDIF